jgi:phospholipase/carboxylesterase
MHGLGDSSEGFLDFFYTEDSVVPNPNTKVILLNAPKQPVTINGGHIMNSWYDILALKGPDVRVDESQIQRSTQRILKVVDSEAKALGNDYTKVFIGGFSQGCCMSLNAGILARERVGGIVGLSGAVFPSL